jgi:hypothetical protein
LESSRRFFAAIQTCFWAIFYGLLFFFNEDFFYFLAAV